MCLKGCAIAGGHIAVPPRAAPCPADVHMRLGHNCGDHVAFGMVGQHMFQGLDPGHQRRITSGFAIEQRVFGGKNHIRPGAKGHEFGHRHPAGCHFAVFVGVMQESGHFLPTFLTHQPLRAVLMTVAVHLFGGGVRAGAPKQGTARRTAA